ncbi:hypothetical protein [Paraburkholderia sp. J67]|uniref:phosphorylase family protein n=1 Tax=Paraburkholderia sp. J67 TaxID=2805435 RepID=UPI002ABE99FB|nr:hypothetical protein [Paraburkholderia sp. J67]
MALNVLLLEDDPAKKTRLLTLLRKRKDLFDQVDTAICTSEARRRMADRSYDLFIVDIVVPEELGEEKSEKHSIALLEELDDEHGDLNRPLFVLPMSASGELTNEAHAFFVGRPWGILPYTETTDECLSTVERVAQFVLKEKAHNADIGDVDVFLITALDEPEFSAVESVDFKWEPLEPLDRSQLIRYGKISSGGEQFRIAAAFCSRMGPVAASILTTKALLMLRPKLIVMAGICAGIPGKADIGDVVATDISWDWQSGKYIDKHGTEAFQIAPHQIGIDDVCQNALIKLKRDQEFWASLAPLTAGVKRTNAPKLVIGPMATGSSVLADARVADRIKQNQHKNVVGLDMETYAVYAAARASDSETKVVSLKAVCDKGDKKKNDEYQPYAAQVSARTVARFLEQNLAVLIRKR